MRLIDEWRQVARRAWSIRINIIAAVLSGGVAVTALIVPETPTTVFLLVVFVLNTAAPIARLLAQSSMHTDKGDDDASF